MEVSSAGLPESGIRVLPKLCSRPLLLVTALLYGVLAPWFTHAATGVFLDQGGAIFNVKAYGAAGNGTTSDSGAIQAALEAAKTAGGGVVYFPAGTYLINTPITNSRSDIVSLVGSGMGSQLRIGASPGINVPPPAGRLGFSNGRISNLRLVCTAPTQAAVTITDAVVAPELSDLVVANCNVGFELVNTTYWTERLVVNRVSDERNNHLFHLHQSPTNANNSYGYGLYNGIFLDKGPGQDVFYLTGGAYLYHSTIVIKGNFDFVNAPGAAIFNVQGAAGEPCPGAAHNTYDIAVEGVGYAVVKAANNGCSGGATGNTLVAGVGTINAAGAVAGTTSWIRTSGNAAFLVGILTTTGALSDTLSGLGGVTPGLNCYAQPANSVAAQMVAGTYVSATNWGTVTVSHPAVAGGKFQIWCQ